MAIFFEFKINLESANPLALLLIRIQVDITLCNSKQQLKIFRVDQHAPSALRH